MKNLMHKSILYLLFSTTLILGCQSNEQTFDPIKLEAIPLESTNSGMPNLFTNSAGDLYLSWIEKVEDSLAVLQYAQLNNGQWSSPQIIAKGTNWFVNWADFPSMAQFPNTKQLMGHWLQKRAEGTYDYDVHLSISEPSGAKWNPSFIPHRDSIAAEHGFVTLAPLANGNIQAVWLDGRNTKAGADSHEHGHGGAMTLRTAEVDSEGRLHEEYELDARVCDCCQTDAALSAAGQIVVYRDRSPSEIRDIALVRKVDERWLSPQIIGQDQWQINGCPVNGPAIAANNKKVAVAWFTMANDTPKVQVALSIDNAATFSKVLNLTANDPIGRVDILFIDEEHLAISWIDGTEEGANIQVTILNMKGEVLQQQTVAAIDPSRKSGFPILEQGTEGIVLAWTMVKEDQSTEVKTAFIRK